MAKSAMEEMIKKFLAEVTSSSEAFEEKFKGLEAFICAKLVKKNLNSDYYKSFLAAQISCMKLLCYVNGGNKFLAWKEFLNANKELPNSLEIVGFAANSILQNSTCVLGDSSNEEELIRIFGDTLNCKSTKLPITASRFNFLNDWVPISDSELKKCIREAYLVLKKRIDERISDSQKNSCSSKPGKKKRERERKKAQRREADTEDVCLRFLTDIMLYDFIFRLLERKEELHLSAIDRSQFERLASSTLSEWYSLDMELSNEEKESFRKSHPQLKIIQRE